MQENQRDGQPVNQDQPVSQIPEPQRGDGADVSAGANPTAEAVDETEVEIDAPTAEAGELIEAEPAPAEVVAENVEGRV